jgi:hypothetical protein
VNDSSSATDVELNPNPPRSSAGILSLQMETKKRKEVLSRRLVGSWTGRFGPVLVLDSVGEFQSLLALTAETEGHSMMCVLSSFAVVV